jgi:hypothetical protein
MENFELTLKLTIAQTNVVLKYLGTGAYAEVSDLIAALHAQAKPQVDAAMQSIPVGEEQASAE